MRPSQTMIPSALAELPFGEKLVLWSMRLWARAYAEEASAQDYLRTSFKLAGASAVRPALDNVMSVLATVGHGSIDVRQPQCSEISFGEHRLMLSIAAWQLDAGAAADRYLVCWLPMAALRLIRAPLRQLADALACAGLYVRPKPFKYSLADWANSQSTASTISTASIDFIGD